MLEGTTPLTRGLLAVGVMIFVCGSLASVGVAAIAITVPAVLSARSDQLLAELPSQVDQLRKLQLARAESYGSFVPCGSRGDAVRSLTPDRRDPATDPAAPCLTLMLGWTPPQFLLGAYWIEVDAATADFTVHGIIDVDDDGNYAEYQASASESARLATPPGVR
ncbi:MAG: hypothetical protein EXR71_15300 [Myxococcales bacterium]|nr:hypothetical protein [Myxococcales bacterium]